MAVHDIAYVELYAKNKASAVEHFVSTLGFTQVADCVQPDRSSALLRQNDVQIVVTSGPGVWSFLDEHGDGIADIALTCDDVAATRDAALAAGAVLSRPVRDHPVVSGFGGVTHTLLPLAEKAALPEGRNWVATPGAAQRPTGRIEKIDHVAVCLEGGSLDHYADFYNAAFAMARYSSEYVALGGQAMDSIVVRSDSGNVICTLVAPVPGKEPGQLDAFLERNCGPGVQHLAFLVDDIIPAVGAFRDQGAAFLSTPDSYYDALAGRVSDLPAEVAELRAAQVLVDRDEWGHLLQVFTRSSCERNTLFHELIQRRGSRGFGSANIRALYEAVERDRLTAG